MMRTLRKIALIRRGSDERGVAVIEFAFAAPFLVLLYIGAYQFSDAIACYRKVTITTRTLADLTSQFSIVTQSDINSILNASTQVMAPYSADAETQRISQITTDGTGKSTISWSQGDAKYAKGMPVVLPTSIAQNNTSVILSEINYAYTPKVGKSMIGPFTLSDKIYMFPRRSASITCSGCT